MNRETRLRVWGPWPTDDIESPRLVRASYAEFNEGLTNIGIWSAIVDGKRLLLRELRKNFLRALGKFVIWSFSVWVSVIGDCKQRINGISRFSCLEYGQLRHEILKTQKWSSL